MRIKISLIFKYANILGKLNNKKDILDKISLRARCTPTLLKHSDKNETSRDPERVQFVYKYMH